MRKSIRELKDGLSECVRRVQQGEEIIVTSHNRPVAKLVPLSEPDRDGALTRDDLMAELGDLRAAVQGAVRGKPLSRVVTESRQEERY